MSKGYNKNGVFVDTGLLRDHVSKLREERKTAIKLYDSVAAMRNCCDPVDAYKYGSVLHDIEQLIEYLTKMSKLLDRASDGAARLSHELGERIEGETERTYHVSSRAFML